MGLMVGASMISLVEVVGFFGYFIWLIMGKLWCLRPTKK